MPISCLSILLSPTRRLNNKLRLKRRRKSKLGLVKVLFLPICYADHLHKLLLILTSDKSPQDILRNLSKLPLPLRNNSGIKLLLL